VVEHISLRSEEQKCVESTYNALGHLRDHRMTERTERLPAIVHSANCVQYWRLGCSQPFTGRIVTTTNRVCVANLRASATAKQSEQCYECGNQSRPKTTTGKLTCMRNSPGSRCCTSNRNVCPFDAAAVGPRSGRSFTRVVGWNVLEVHCSEYRVAVIISSPSSSPYDSARVAFC
jgi:hypothetical protein